MKKAENKFSMNRGLGKHVLILVLVFSMIITTVQMLPAAMTTSKAADGATNVTIHFYNEFAWEAPAVQFWGGSATEVTGAEAGPTEITGWGGAQGYTMTAEADNWYSLTLTGDFTGFQFLDMSNPGSNTGGKGYNAYMTQYNGDTPVDLYCQFNESTGYDCVWYMDAEYTTPLPVPEDAPAVEDCTVTVHYLNQGDWSEVYAYVTETGSWTAIEGYTEYSVWPGAIVSENADNAGWYDLMVRKKNDTMMNWIFNNNAGSQTDNMYATDLAGYTFYEVWCIGSTVYTEAPEGWIKTENSINEYFVIGVDSNSFPHASIGEVAIDNEIGTSYPTSLYYYQKLRDGLTWTEEIKLLDAMTDTNTIEDESDTGGWAGSCEGLSISLGLTNLGKLDISGFGTTGVNIPTCYHDLEMNVDSNHLRNLINYYQLLQYVDKIAEPTKQINNFTEGVPILDGKWTTGSGKKQFWDAFVQDVEAANQKGVPLLFSMSYRKSNGILSGHTILTCGYDENSQYDIIQLYDCNNRSSYLYLFIDKESRDFEISFTKDSITPYKGYASNDNWKSFQYYNADIWDTFDTSVAPAVSRKRTVELENVSSINTSDDKAYVVFTVDADKAFKITDSTGNYLEYKDGQLGGNIDLYSFDILGDGRTYEFTIKKDDNYTVRDFEDNTKFTIRVGNHYYSASAVGADAIYFHNDKGIGFDGDAISYVAGISIEESESLMRISGSSSEQVDIMYDDSGIVLNAESRSATTVTVINQEGCTEKDTINGSDSVVLDEYGNEIQNERNDVYHTIHEFTQPVFQWNGLENCIATIYCVDDDFCCSYDCVISHECENGITVYTATVIINGIEYTDIKSGEVNGTITSYGNPDDTVTVSLMNGDEEVSKVETTDGTYELTSVPSGTYTLQITKANHVTRTYEITVGSENITQDVKLCLLGDVTGDGKVNTRDLNRIYAHVNGTDLLTDYPFACGDVIGPDGKINTRDLNRLYAHINESNPLWAEN